MDQRLPAAEDEWMEQSTRRPDRPLWVQVALWGLPNRISVWVCFWLSFILTVVSISCGFVDVASLREGSFFSRPSGITWQSAGSIGMTAGERRKPVLLCKSTTICAGHQERFLSPWLPTCYKIVSQLKVKLRGL